MDGKLREARAALIACGAHACPEHLQDDCVRWRAALETEIPTISVQVRTDVGDATEVQIFLDGELLVPKLDGRPIQLDPGKYVLSAILPNGKRASQQVVVAQGQRDRLIAFDLRTPAAPAPAPRPTRPVPVLTYVLGAVAASGLAAGTAFGLDAVIQKANAGRCLPLCSSKTSDQISTSAAIADAALGISVTALITGAVLYLTRPVVFVAEMTTKEPGPAAPQSPDSRRERIHAKHARPSLDVSARSVSLVWQGTF